MKNPFKKPSPYELAVERLDETQRNLLDAQALHERAEAEVALLKRRETRLQQEIRRYADVPKS